MRRDDDTAAYEDALTRCNTSWAPWHIIPADRNWHRDVVISELLRHTLERMDPQLPQPKEDLPGVMVESSRRVPHSDTLMEDPDAKSQ